MTDKQATRQDVQRAARPNRRKRFARHSPRAWFVLIVVLALGLAVDLYSKAWAFANVHRQPVELHRKVLLANTSLDPTLYTERMNLLPGDVLGLRLALNRGAVLGIAANQRWFFIGFTIIVLVGGLYVFGTRFFPRETTAHCALGLVMAGALGNFYDRVVFGVVRDFIQFMPGRRLPNGWMWPGGNPELMPWVFNIADVLLLVGLVTLMTFVGRRRRRRRRRKAGI